MKPHWAAAVLCAAAAVPGHAQLVAPVASVLGQAAEPTEPAPGISGPGIGFGNRAQSSADAPRATDAGSWWGLVAGSHDTDRVVAGVALGEQLAAEAGLVRLGSLAQSDGRGHATGFDLGALVRLPLGSALAAYARLGLLWSRGTAAGSTRGDSGWGASYGAGLRVALTAHWRVQLGWERQAPRLAGARQRVDSAGLGLLYQR